MDYSEMPESVFESERFEIPKVKGHIQGHKTVISNFYAIADCLGRTPEHLLKYILKELATPGTIQNRTLFLGSKVPASRINEKIRKYASEYVLCPDCGKPDTKIISEGDLSFMKCQACGSKHQVKSMKAAKL
jgi:translation initiation factor 2 subunit 2